MILRRSRRTVVPDPVQTSLPSATPGVSFHARITARYRLGRTQHDAPDSVVRTRLVLAACDQAACWQADQLCAAADAVNAEIGRPAHCPRRVYRDLIGHADLWLDAAGTEAAELWHQQKTHVERLKYLKATLYSDPALLLIDHLQRHPNDLDNAELDKYRSLSDRLQERERWWSSLMVAWNDLAAQTQSPQAAEASMHILLDAIRRLDSKLADRHGLPPYPPPSQDQ
jgi:hypothetical protein